MAKKKIGWRRGGTTFASVGLDVIGIDYEHGATSTAARQHTMQRNMVTSSMGSEVDSEPGIKTQEGGGVVACVYPNPSPHVPNEMHRVTIRVYQTFKLTIFFILKYKKVQNKI